MTAGLVYSLRYPTVQTYFAKKAAAYLSSELQTTVSLSGIYFDPFSSLVLHGLYVEDLNGDTLLYSGRMAARINLGKLINSEIAIRYAHLSDSRFSLKRDEKGSSNLAFLANYFSPAGNASGSTSPRITWNIDEVVLDDVSLRYKMAGGTPRNGAIDFRDVELAEISGNFSDIDIGDHLFKSTISGLTMREKSGFRIREMNAAATVDTNRLELTRLDVTTNRSRIRDYLLLEYADFSAFDDFVNQVAVTLELNRAQVNSNDIAYFAPNIRFTDFDVVLSGNLAGRVPAFSTDHIVLETGNSTRLEGAIAVRGLPDIRRTVFDLQLEELQTSSAEIESLVPQLGNTAAFDLPIAFDRMGNVRYQGSLTGQYHDFIVNGTLNTELGAVHTNVHLNLSNDRSYSGKLWADTFDMGGLLGYAQLGGTGFDVVIDGSGFTAQEVNGTVEGQISYLDFHAYRYRAIDLKGRFSDMLFAGELQVADPNVQLAFDGEANFNPRNPSYRFRSHVDYANFYELGLYDEQPLTITNAAVTSDFTGSSINTIQGSVDVSGVDFQINTSPYRINSVRLLAKGDAEHRVLALTSDVADATLTGEIDLNTLDNYFKSVAMRYAPALQLAVEAPSKQAFHVDMVLKNFAALRPFVAPDLLIGSGSILSGYFSSTAGIANFNLLVPEAYYRNVRIDQLIVDETTSNEALRLLVTADRISLADSVYIDNVNMTNTLANDSLHFNLKLSHTAASNQLDLNGLVQFNAGEPAALHFMPSVVTLNGEPWQLGNRARLYFDGDQLRVHDLMLANARQTVRLDGVISPRAEDEAVVTFNNFDLRTFNGATKPSGIELQGILNGQMTISSLLKNPYFIADIGTHDIRYNDIDVGDLVLQADFDQHTQLVNVNMEVKNRGVNTIIATGTYNASAVNKLDMLVKLNQTELLLFQPLLKNLVSDITGTVSADIRVTGTALDPQVDGRFSLHNAGFTVNYLRTPYRIDDEVYLSNTTLLLTNLLVVDPRGNQALANGTVDLSNLQIPEIDLVIDATNFLVLNTTLRDNPFYYGTVYGTGKFAFTGPTNAITINIQARTADHSKLSIPLNAVGTVSDNDFIRFVSPDTLESRKPTAPLLKGLSMNMDFQVTPAAEISLYTDLGELSGRGEGLLSLRVSSLGDFEMFGDYAINNGTFTFTAQDFINKIFEINQGGSIRWTGQPTEATINLTAVYDQRTSLAPLYNAAGRETNEQRVLAQAQMILSGSLMQPDITFGLNFPNDPYVKDELQSYLSDVNNVNQQTLSLIVRRSFTPGSATDFSRELNNTLLSAGTELAFNQLNNLIAQSLNLNFVDLNIRSLNDASASVHLFNNRLIFTGGVTDRRNLTDLNVFGNYIATDAELQYLIRKDGRLVLRASNRLNSRNFLLNLNDNNYVSALGLVYRQEFYTFGEFLRRLFTIREEEEEAESQVF